jgi:hypothetical protein
VITMRSGKHWRIYNGRQTKEFLICLQNKIQVVALKKNRDAMLIVTCVGF